MKTKLFELIGGAVAALVFNGFIFWALFLAPAYLAT